MKYSIEAAEGSAVIAALIITKDTLSLVWLCLLLLF